MYFQNGADGMANVTSCANNIPLFSSQPRYLGVDRYVADQVGGESKKEMKAEGVSIRVDGHVGTELYRYIRIYVYHTL